MKSYQQVRTIQVCRTHLRQKYEWQQTVNKYPMHSGGLH